MTPSRDIARLIEIMAALRTPGTGCPWDLEQSFETIAPYTLEEAHEVLDAIRRGDLVDLREELGDLLLQVVYHARMAEETGAFAFADVVEGITRKLIRRHPHVFGDGTARDPGAVKAAWEAIKAEEKAEKAALRGGASAPGEPPAASALHGIKGGLSPMKRAVALQAAAGTVGFDWNDARAVLAKLREETAEIAAALDAGASVHVAEEIGDHLIVVANLARHARGDPDTAITAANAKFTRRFRAIEEALWARGIALPDATLDEMEAEWRKVKARETRPRE